MEATPLDKKMTRWALPALIFFAVLAAFSPCLDNGFVTWDDGFNLLSNRSFRGLGWTQLRWMFEAPHFGLYQPLTWLTYGVDFKLWGLEAWGYHLTSILLHAATAVLFYFVSLRLFEKAAPQARPDARALGAAAAALAFAVHPLRVESVAWATERRDVLSGALLLACVWAYIEERVAASCCLFALSLSAKVSGVFLPAALLVLDAYPLGRRGRWREKIPFVLIAAVFAGVTLNARGGPDEVRAFSRVNAAWRAGQALHGLAEYPLKTLWPAGLAAYYPPRPWFGHWFPQAAALAALAAAAGAALWAARKRFPAFPAAAAWSVLALAPVSGIVQHGLTYSVFDRYSYLPSLGGSVLFGAAVMQARRAGRGAALAAAGLLLAVGGAQSWNQSMVWRDTASLWEHSSRVEPSAIAFDNLAVAQAARGDFENAAASARRATSLDPSFVSAYGNLGSALNGLGRRKEAEAAWVRGLTLEPESQILNARLGSLLAQGDGARRAQGLALLRLALDSDSGGAIHDELASALARGGDVKEARREYESALAADQDDAAAHVNLGLLLDSLGDPSEARRHYRKALQDRDQRAAAHADWGNSLLAQGLLDEAAFHYGEAIRINPGLTPAQVNLGNILARRGRFAEAASRYRAALKETPGSFEARGNLRAVERLLKR